jgi:hypothetical protein
MPIAVRRRDRVIKRTGLRHAVFAALQSTSSLIGRCHRRWPGFMDYDGHYPATKPSQDRECNRTPTPQRAARRRMVRASPIRPVTGKKREKWNQNGMIQIRHYR